MDSTRIAAAFEWLEARTKLVRLSVAPALVLMIIAVFVLVYATGGIKYVFSHSMYLPIVLAGLTFGVRGGLLAGIAGGLALGPWMPIDTSTGEQQLTINWLYRTGFFSLIGFLSGFASDSARGYMHHLKWLVRHEGRTGLPNRLALLERLRVSADTGRYALVQMSLENSSELEAAFGHRVTDIVIQQLADRFSGQFRHAVGVYRIATHELSGLVPYSDPCHLDTCLRELTLLMREPLDFRGLSLHGDVRIAWVEVSELGKSAVDSLQQAEAALLYGRERRLDMTPYSEAIDRMIAENIQLLGELKNSLDAGHLEMHYQPKVNAVDGRVRGVEALMRWNHPRLGNIPPSRFILRAEQSTLIEQLTDFAMDSALAQLVRWRAAGLDISVAVNISPHNLVEPDFVARVLNLLDKHGIDGHLLELEVTEGAFLYDIHDTVQKLTCLAGANISVAIDDFGTGYSSLKYLYDLPASVIKIDQSFVRDLPNDRGGASIVETALLLAGKMGMTVVAEGVETLAARDYLRRLGCDLLQGYFIARPMNATDMTAWYQALPVPGCWRPSHDEG